MTLAGVTLEPTTVPCPECEALGWVAYLDGPFERMGECERCRGSCWATPRSEDEAFEWAEGWL